MTATNPTATIQVAGATATLEGDTWTSDDPAVARELNRVSPLFPLSGSDPHPLLTKATQVADVFGGDVLRCDEPDELEEGLLY